MIIFNLDNFHGFRELAHKKRQVFLKRRRTNTQKHEIYRTDKNLYKHTKVIFETKISILI